MSISRARSWPLLDLTGMGGCAAAAVAAGDGASSLEQKSRKAAGPPRDGNNADAAQTTDGSSQVQARRLLCRHYYPEGEWGWVITVIGILVHLLGPGLQLSIPAAAALPAKVKFYHHPLHTAGEFEIRRARVFLFYTRV